MKMGIYSVLTMDGRLMDAGRVLGSLKLHLMDPKLELLNHPELVLPGSQLWCLKVCCLCGLMKMVWNELVPPSLQCNH